MWLPPLHPWLAPYSSLRVHLVGSQMGALGQVLPLPSPIAVWLWALPSVLPPAPLGVGSATLYLGVYKCPGLLTKGRSSDTQHNFGVTFLIHHK